MNEESEWEKSREEKRRREERIRFAGMVFRDLCLLERRRLDEMKPDGCELPVDYKCAATCAVEAADALIAAVDFDETKSVLPPYSV